MNSAMFTSEILDVNIQLKNCLFLIAISEYAFYNLTFCICYLHNLCLCVQYIHVYNYAVSYNVCPVSISMVQVFVYISPCILSGFQIFISCGLVQARESPYMVNMPARPCVGRIAQT